MVQWEEYSNTQAKQNVWNQAELIGSLEQQKATAMWQYVRYLFQWLPFSTVHIFPPFATCLHTSRSNVLLTVPVRRGSSIHFFVPVNHSNSEKHCKQSMHRFIPWCWKPNGLHGVIVSINCFRVWIQVAKSLVTISYTVSVSYSATALKHCWTGLSGIFAAIPLPEMNTKWVRCSSSYPFKLAAADAE